MILMRSDRVLGAIGAAIIWGVYFAAVYSVQGLGCVRGWQHIGFAGTNALTAAMVALTVATLAAIAWNGWRGWQGWDACRRAPGGAQEIPQRIRFLGLLMMTTAAVSFVATLFMGITIVMLDPCAA